MFSVIFPGQGSQIVGMGKEFYDKFNIDLNIYATSLSKRKNVCFNKETYPELEIFKELNRREVIQLRIVPAVGAERFAQFVYDKVNPFIMDETDGRVRIARVEFREHDKNSAIYEPGQD